MLERAQACLNRKFISPGSSNQCVPASQRLLHCAFWTHAIPNDGLELYTTLGRYSRHSSADVRPHNGPLKGGETSRPFLDFLYPPQAVAYVSAKASSAYSHATQVQRSPLRPRRVRPRNFSAVARVADRQLSHEAVTLDPSPFRKRVHDDTAVYKTHVSAQSTSEDSLRELQQLITQESPLDLERLWTCFGKAHKARIIGPDLLRRTIDTLSSQCNSSSSWFLLAIYDMLRSSERTDHVLQVAVEAQSRVVRADSVPPAPLKCFFLDRALPPRLMQQAVSLRDWKAAIQILHNETQRLSPDSARLSPRDITTLFQGINDIKELKNSLRDIVECFPTDDRGYHAIFEALCRQMCFKMRGLRDPVRLALTSHNLCRILNEDKVKSAVSADLLQSIISMLLALHHTRSHAIANDTIASVYQLYHSLKLVPPPKLLTLLLTAHDRGDLQSTHGRHVLTLKDLLTDWTTHYGPLNNHTLFMLMRKASRIGDVRSVEKHAQQYLALNIASKPQARHMWPLLYVFAMKRNAAKADYWFDRLQHEHGMTADARCWSTLLFAHQRAGQPRRALEILLTMQDQGLAPDVFTLGPVASAFGKIGDVQTVTDILDVAQRHKLVPSTIMLNALIVAHVSTGDLEGAANALSCAISKVREGEAEGSLTVCFNTMMTAYGMSKQPKLAMQLYRDMKVSETELDSNSYGALMKALCRSHQSTKAYQILTQVLPGFDIKPAPFHYAICMSGFIKDGMHERALAIHQDMLDAGVKPNIGTRAAYVRASTMAIGKDDAIDAEDPVSMTDAVRALLQGVGRPKDHATYTKDPEPDWYRQQDGTTSSLAYFDYILDLLGRKQCFEAVQQLLKDQLAQSGTLTDLGVPLNVLNSMMSVHLLAGDHQAVHELWELVRSQVDQVQRVQGSESGTAVVESKATDQLASPVPAHRLALSRPLGYYLGSLGQKMKAMATESELDEEAETSSDDIVKTMNETVSSLLSSSYTLDNQTWNLYICNLCQASPPRALLAFTLTEKFLMDKWKGWDIPVIDNESGSSTLSVPTTNPKRTHSSYHRSDEPVMQYKTSVYLTHALLRLRRMDLQARESTDRGRYEQESSAQTRLDIEVGTVKAVRERAPKALRAVLEMPVVRDDLQRRLLRT